MKAKAPRRRQCTKCPWKKGTNPNEIPNGYDPEKHRALANTIAEPGTFYGGPIKLMACHESPIGNELPCVGWLNHQLGLGNNVALRLRVRLGLVDADFDLVGEQHRRFEDTLPKAMQARLKATTARRGRT